MRIGESLTSMRFSCHIFCRGTAKLLFEASVKIGRVRETAGISNITYVSAFKAVKFLNCFLKTVFNQILYWSCFSYLFKQTKTGTYTYISALCNISYCNRCGIIIFNKKQYLFDTEFIQPGFMGELCFISK